MFEIYEMLLSLFFDMYKQQRERDQTLYASTECYVLRIQNAEYIRTPIINKIGKGTGGSVRLGFWRLHLQRTTTIGTIKSLRKPNRIS